MDEVLFDGRSLDGWAMAGSGGFELVDGVLESRGGMGLLWYTRREFGDFMLELDWRVHRPADNSGVFIRFPHPGGDPWSAVDQGYEIQILDDAEESTSRTGAIYRFAAPRAVPSRPPGEWNHFVIRVQGQRYRVLLNGEPVTNFTGNRALSGFVGLQNHDQESKVQFRDVRTEDLERGSTAGEEHPLRPIGTAVGPEEGHPPGIPPS